MTVIERWTRLAVRVVIAGAVGVCGTATARAGLVKYVEKPDAAFHWEVRRQFTRNGATVYDLHLVSQVWQSIKWEHQLQVYQPNGVAPRSTMLLWNTGGSANPGDVMLGIMLAKKIKAPVAFLYNIPNQPLFNGKKEDSLIAETFVRFLATQDEDWPLLFPMVKSVVRAMDALQAFSRTEWHRPLNGFIISGASKRGWTTWLTAAADPRVRAIAPVVIDTLNMGPQNHHQLEAFGRYSEEIADYTSRGLVPVPDNAPARRLWSMVDPYFYRDRLTVPKFIMNGTNDPYWTLDALNLYWDGLRGDKWILYVPNAGHNLQERHADGHRDITRAFTGLAAFAHSEIYGERMPHLRWKHSDADGKPRLRVESDPPPRGARVWVADAPTQDFRKSTWTERPATQDGKEVRGEIDPPAQGYRAFFAELDFQTDGIPYHLSTQIRIVGPKKEAIHGASGGAGGSGK